MMPFPEIGDVIASSTTQISTFFAYVWPTIFFPFIVVVVVSAVGLIIGMIYWFGHKVENLATGHRSDGQKYTPQNYNFDEIRRMHDQHYK